VSMHAYVVRRLALGIIVLFGISIVTFVLARVVPSDPAALYAGPGARAPAIEEARRMLKLDAPLYQQYLRYMWGLVRGDWGTSLRTHRAVLADVLAFLPVTLELVFSALLFALLVGVALGVLTADRKGRVIDFVMRIVAVVGVSLPAFFVALVFQVIFFRALHLLPAAGMFTRDVAENFPVHHVTGAPLVDALITGNFTALGDGLRCMVLPVLALAAYPTGVVMRMTRSTMLETLGQDYIRMARALGVPRRTIIYRFALKNSLGPVLTVTGLMLAYSIIGAFFIELIFAWPGIGTYGIASIMSLDYPAILAVTVLVAVIYVAANLVVDLAMAWLDPRVIFG
jgi:ABC-type dipeptide/oligopeptide/nickel transport system permease component